MIYFRSLGLVILLTFSLFASAQIGDPIFSSPITSIPPISTHKANPGTDWFFSLSNHKRTPPPQEEQPSYIHRIKSQINQQKLAAPYQSTVSSRELAPAPVMLNGFQANDYNGAHPNDNHLAISSIGKIVSVSNSQFCVFDTRGQLLKKVSLQAFADTIGQGEIKFDPRVIYHAGLDRFVTVFLSGTQSANSKVILAFSATQAPEGAWHLYALPGSPAGAGVSVYADYPQIGLSDRELFISLNLYGDNDDLYGACIWQIDALRAFQGDSLDLKYHLLPGRHSLCPINQQPQPVDASFYFVRKHKLQASDAFTFFEIRTPLSNGGIMASPITLGSKLNYYLSPDNSQKGSPQLLNNGDSRLQAAYRMDSSCYFVMPTRDQNRPAIYLGHLQMHPNGLAFSHCSASIITHDTLELAYPNITYAGYCSAQGQHAHAITFNYSSPWHYPGNGLVYVDTSGRASQFSLNRQSQQPTGTGNSNQPFRWGDYTGIASRWPGEVWTAGYYIRADGHNSSWLAQLKLGDNPLLNLQEPSKEPPWGIFPNPAHQFFQLDVQIPQAGLYEIRILDSQGKSMATLLKDKLWPGAANFRFDTQALAPGVYFVEIRSDHFQALKKLQIQ